jgi:hypothetical protein
MMPRSWSLRIRLEVQLVPSGGAMQRDHAFGSPRPQSLGYDAPAHTLGLLCRRAPELLYSEIAQGCGGLAPTSQYRVPD